MTSTELINTTRRQPTTRASASRSSAKRTAEANTRYRDDLTTAATRQTQRDVVAGWKRFLESKMLMDVTGTYIPFVLNGMVEERAASDTAAERRRMLTNVC